MPVAIRSLQSLPERHGPTGRQGMRIATPACGLVRNDVGCFTLCVFTLGFGRYTGASRTDEQHPGVVFLAALRQFTFCSPLRPWDIAACIVSGRVAVFCNTPFSYLALARERLTLSPGEGLMCYKHPCIGQGFLLDYLFFAFLVTSLDRANRAMALGRTIR